MAHDDRPSAQLPPPNALPAPRMLPPPIEAPIAAPVGPATAPEDGSAWAAPAAIARPVAPAPDLERAPDAAPTAVAPPAAERTRSGWAVAALVQGVVGLVTFVLIVQSVLALVFGWLAAREIGRSDGRLRGIRLARLGSTLGAVGLVAGLLFWAPIIAGLVGDDAQRTDLLALQVGDCADVAGLDRSATAIPVVDCRGPHDAEVFLVGKLDPERSTEYPGDQPVGETVIRRCTEAAFTDYVGRPFSESELDVFVLVPHASRWAQDGGAFACLARSVEGVTLVGSVRGSGR